MKRTLKVKDIERLENTSFAAVGALAATPVGAQMQAPACTGVCSIGLTHVDPVGCGSVSCVGGGSCTAICSIGVSGVCDGVTGAVICSKISGITEFTEPPPCTGVCSIGITRID